MTNVTGTITLNGTLTIGSGPATKPGYDLLGCGLSSIQRRRDTVTSPWVKGEAEIASVEGALTYDLVVQCVGTSWSSACTLATAVQTIAEMKAWTLVEVFDGHTESFACSAAMVIDKPIERDLMINARRAVTLSIPVTRA